MNQRLQNAFEQITALSLKNPQIASIILEPLRCLLQKLKYPKSDAGSGSTVDGFEVTRNQNEIERKRVDQRLKGFSVKNSFGWKIICDFYGPNLNQAELLSLAEVLAQQLNLKVDREAKRRKEVLIKWFDENIGVIQPILPLVKLEDNEGRPVTGNFGEHRM